VFINNDYVPLQPNNGEEEWWAANDLVPADGTKFRPAGMSAYVAVHVHLGTETTGDAWFQEKSGGQWTADRHVGHGLCWARLTLRYRAEAFNPGRPNVAFLVRGNKLLDPRTGETGWSANSTVVLEDYLRSRLGYSAVDDDINADCSIAAADVCDEPDPVNGADQPRYEFNGIITSEMTRRQACEAIADSMAGSLVVVGGEFRIYAGEPSPVVATITQDDFAGGYEITPSRPRNELYNRLTATFFDRQRQHAKASTPVIRKAA
jgi:hypothetical protein